MTSIFPTGFESLDRFAPWALPRQRDRCARRLVSSAEELQELYDTLLSVGDAAFEHLDSLPPGPPPAAAVRLALLLLALAEVRTSIEVHGAVWPAELMTPDRLTPIGTTDDRSALPDAHVAGRSGT